MNTPQTSEIYYAPRGAEFRILIEQVLKLGKIKKKYIDMLLNTEGMSIYNKVFTSSSADAEENYEVFEQLGDMSANKFIVWYMYERFPQLNCPKGLKVVARLRINYGAKQSFYKISEQLGFWKFISASTDERSKNKKSLLEDALEAFMGATEYILNNAFCNGVGYAIVYDILKAIFDDMDISLKYESLYDNKTRLKELFDYYNRSVYITDFKVMIDGQEWEFSIPVETFRIVKTMEPGNPPVLIEFSAVSNTGNKIHNHFTVERDASSQISIKGNGSAWKSHIAKILTNMEMRPAKNLGVLVYEEEKREERIGDDVFNINYSTVYRVVGGYGKKKTEGGRKIKLGEGSASLKADAQQKAALVGLQLLNSQGYKKAIPEIYAFFCK